MKTTRPSASGATPRRTSTVRSGLLTRPVSVAGGVAIGAVISAASLLGACGGSDDPRQDQPVTIAVAGPNAVSTWNEIA